MRIVQEYPNRDIPSPEPVLGRIHCSIQTDQYVEQLTDKPPEEEIGVATEFYLDRPPVPLFQPRMPAKENCKSTQIFDGDHELFDFQAEVEPMLNVLIQKTLEQARMEVLEEKELSIIKAQSKEYQEVRNAELIEAQRMEAAEARVHAEISRRGIQQKARKSLRKAAHQKLVCRTVAKRSLQNMREAALQQLHDQGLLTSQIEKSLYEDVLPWLYEKVDEFLADSQDVTTTAFTMIETGIRGAQTAHGVTLEGIR